MTERHQPGQIGATEWTRSLAEAPNSSYANMRPLHPNEWGTMELFVCNGELPSLDNSLATTPAAQDLPAVIRLAWHLRQRDCTRALRLADAADAMLVSVNVPDPEQRRAKARLLLIRAEIKLLSADLPEAQRLTDAAALAFRDLADPTGCGDAQWLQASIWVDRGDSAQVSACIEMAAQQYQVADDPLRQAVAQARYWVNASFHDPVAAARGLAEQFPLDVSRTASVQAWVATARANVAGLTNDPGGAIRLDLQAYELALDTGQIRHALVAVTNAAESFATLGDLDAALEWCERALVLARKTGWPASIGVCMMQIGDVLRLLRRYGEARSYLQQALTLMAAQRGSRNYELGVSSLGQLELDTGAHRAGLQWFVELEETVKPTEEHDLLVKAWRGQAVAFLCLGQAREAELKASAALALARRQGSLEAQIQVLRVLAQLHTQHVLPLPDAMTAPSAALHYLEQAMALADSMADYEMSAELLDEMAGAYATADNFKYAYQFSLAAGASRSRLRHIDAQKLAVTLKIRDEVEQAREEATHHRLMAATLKETANTLETLGVIGREITASLSIHNVFEILHRRIDQLLDATTFVVYLMEPDQRSLRTAYGIEAGRPLPTSLIALDSPTSMSARCARERQQVLIELEPGIITENLIPGTIPTYSLLYAPLMLGERLLGVMSIQSPSPGVYGPRERSIFHTLCSYGAIALDNASAYTAVAAAQRHAEQKEQALRASEALKSAIMDHSTVALITTDAGGKVVEFNPAAEALFGRSRAQVLGWKISEVVMPEHLRSNYNTDTLHRLRAMETAIMGKRMSLRALRSDGCVFPIEMLLWRTEVEGRTFYTSSIVDLSERQAADEKIAQQREALRQSEKLSAMGSLLAGVAHELNNPLAIVMGRASLLREKVLDDAPGAAIAADLQRICDAAERCGRIVRTFLNMARQRPVERGPVNLHDLIEASIDMLAYGFRSHGIELQKNLACPSPWLLADGDQIGQIVLNLLVNAQQSLAEHDGPRHIHVSTGLTPATGTSHVWMRVIDSGPGVDERVRDRLFEPFFTTKAQASGTGMGLSLSRSFAREHGGDLILESLSAAGGAAFKLHLPLGAKPLIAAESPTNNADALNDVSKRILVVDDEHEMVEVIRDILQAEGYKVLSAGSGQQALQILANEAVAATLCDLHMPDMDGAAFWRLACERNPAQAKRIVFVTGDTLSLETRDFVRGSNCPSLEKPFSKLDLLGHVARVLGR